MLVYLINGNNNNKAVVSLVLQGIFTADPFD